MSGSNFTEGEGGGKHARPSAVPGEKSIVILGLIQINTEKEDHLVDYLFEL